MTGVYDVYVLKYCTVPFKNVQVIHVNSKLTNIAIVNQFINAKNVNLSKYLSQNRIPVFDSHFCS